MLFIVYPDFLNHQPLQIFQKGVRKQVSGLHSKGKHAKIGVLSLIWLSRSNYPNLRANDQRIFGIMIWGPAE